MQNNHSSGTDSSTGPIPDIYLGKPLHLAAKNGQNEVVKKLLKNGEEVNGRMLLDFTALHLAAEKGHDEVVRTLLENGANVNQRAMNGKTALRFATSGLRLSTLTLLLQYGADPYAFIERPNKKITASESAASNINRYNEIELIEIIKELDKWGGKINEKFINELTNVTPKTKELLQNLNTAESIEKRDKKLLGEITKSILDGKDDGKIPCTEFVSEIKLRAIKSIKLDESTDHSKIKPIYRKLIELSDIGVKTNDDDNIDKTIKVILQYPKEFDELNETISNLKNSFDKRSITDSQALEVFSNVDLIGTIFGRSCHSLNKALGPKATTNLINNLLSLSANYVSSGPNTSINEPKSNPVANNSKSFCVIS
jgi:hypothetical protein